ncbi:MAG: PSD1 and planctomycete cytochrome C domain-containing protein [Planctomycetaceae bacterium]|nr:PSD1 and planctomycete cytochrome C domain-containing protein [Planctomycetaceae bacterium]
MGILLASFIAGAATAADAPLPERVEFNRDVRPILSDTCFRCHGPDKNHREAELRLDLAEGYAGTADHPGVVTARDVGKSKLFARITSTDPDEVMPPKSLGKTLSARDIAVIKKWIEQGAEYQGHWAFIPPQRPALPTVKNAQAASGEIDRFVLARLETAGLALNPEADRVTLCRRLSFDLTGLPPKPDEVDAFVNDSRPDAYERLVERLLESPHYGERMAVYWMDLVRFADTAGYHSDNPRDIAPYRDYVINAFQQNLPYDRFTTEQLAGDLLPNPTTWQQVASGYNRLLQTTEEGGAQAKEYRAKYSADRVRNVSSVWLGATMACCECHDHKYDPFLTRDFYSVAAFFADVQEADIGRREPGLLVPDAWQSQRLAEFDAQIATAQQKLQTLAEQLVATNTDWTAELDTDAGWETLSPTEVRVEGDSQLLRQEDGSYKVDGKVAAKETYVATIDTELRNVTGLRLEALADDSLPSKGPGSAPNGNFVLTEFKVLVPKADGKPDAVKLTKSVADHAQDKFAVAAAVDGKNDTGWAVLPKVGESHLAIFDAEKPFLTESGQFTVRLEFQSQHAQHSIGRWRLSATIIPAPTTHWVPTEIRDVLAIAPADRTAEQTKRLVEFFRDQSPRFQTERQAVQSIQVGRQKFVDTIPRSLITTALKEPRTVRVLPRGNWMDDSGEVREPAIPTFLGQIDVADRRANRLDLANWLVSKDNPLTARVMVNRMWKLFYGTGLSKTVEDLGSQGEWPTHPELLDWLAVEFRDSGNGWDVKHMVRLMVTSRTYRQSSKLTPQARAADPYNRLLSAQNRFRLDAEFLRDNALSIAGLLSPRIGGESVKPYQPDGYWDYLNFPKRTWVHDKGELLYQRGLYTHWQRSFLHPEMLIFDAPSREECVADRPRSNTPQQALALLNDPGYVEAARVFATRIITDGGGTPASRLRWAFRRALSRNPEDDELALLLKLLDKHRAEYAADTAAADALLKASGESPVPDGLNRVDLAAWTSIARTLLNLHETVTRL